MFEWLLLGRIGSQRQPVEVHSRIANYLEAKSLALESNQEKTEYHKVEAPKRTVPQVPGEVEIESIFTAHMSSIKHNDIT